MRTLQGITRTLTTVLGLALVAAAPVVAAPGGGFLGVYLVEEDKSTDGALIEEVAPDSPAARAGLRKGDKIVQLDGRATPHSKAAIAILTQASPGQRLGMRVSREGWERSMEITLGGREAARTPQPTQPRAQGESGFLGVFLRAGPQGEAVLDGVREGSPAAQAGLQGGDVIKSLDGQEVKDPSSFAAMLSGLPPGRTIKLVVRRGGNLGRDMAVECTLARRTADVTPPAPRARPSQPEPTPTPDARRAPYIGVALVDAEGKGPLKVEDVQAGSPAERFGVRPGDTVLAVDGKDVKSIEQFVKSMEGKFAGDAVTVKIERDGWRSDVRVTLGARE